MCSLVGLFFVRCDAFAVHRCFECWMFRYCFASACARLASWLWILRWRTCRCSASPFGRLCSCVRGLECCILELDALSYSREPELAIFFLFHHARFFRRGMGLCSCPMVANPAISVCIKLPSWRGGSTRSLRRLLRRLHCVISDLME